MTIGETISNAADSYTIPPQSGNPSSPVFLSLAKALESARDRLLDRSLKNKLISTPLESSKARQVRVFDEISDQVFSHLRSKRFFTFSAAKSVKKGENEEEVWLALFF